MDQRIMKLWIVGLFAISSGIARAEPLEDARSAWLSGDRNGAVQILKPLVAKGVPEAEFAIGALTYTYAIQDGRMEDAEYGKELLTKAFRSGHREAAGWLCSILLFDESNRPTLVGDVDRICGAAASDLGKPLADIHIDPDYALNYLVPMARFYEEKGQDLKAASCYGSYMRNFDKLSPGWKSRDRSRLELDNASKGMTGIFLQRTLRGRFRGGQADAFGPLGTEPIPPCGLSSVEIGVLAGSVILKKGLAPN